MNEPSSTVASWPRMATIVGYALLCLGSCTATSDAPLIREYSSAPCLPFSHNPRITPHTREWETTVFLRDGSKVIIGGAQAPGGRIDVFYAASGQTVMAANAGDYVYPTDVRLDLGNDLLYVKAQGLGGGIWRETLLFKFDLHTRQLQERRPVEPGSLPPECSEPSH